MTKIERGKLSRISPVPVRKESSALISLEELLLLEQSRIRDEEAQRRAGEERVLRERLEAEARAQEAERARIRAEADARREALRLEEATRARIEAETHAAALAAQMQAAAAAKTEMMQLASSKAAEVSVATKERRAGQKFVRMVLGLLVLASWATMGFFLLRADAHAASLRTSLTRAEDERDERGRRLAHMIPKEEHDALQAKLQRLEDESRARALATPTSTRPREVTTVPAPSGKGGTKQGADPCDFYRKLRGTNPQDPRLFDPANGCL